METLSQFFQSDALGCKMNKEGENNSCKTANRCMYHTPELPTAEHQFLSCNPCSEVYPWLANPTGSMSDQK
ncbi:unnamed protein product [Thelazia callipaeda]|uniref:SCP domain-containing protein n=1 Tax=Thelazia callipaeda TaxID=103827 RepID=A0A0N5CTP3_THECL|nr:unnamed protein product [Thelazia callipaeda]